MKKNFCHELGEKLLKRKFDTFGKLHQTHQNLEKHRPLKLKKVLEEIEPFYEQGTK